MTVNTETTTWNNLGELVKTHLSTAATSLKKFLANKAQKGEEESSLALVTRAAAVLAEIEGRTIKTDQEYEAAAADLLAVKALQKQVDAARVDLVDPLNKAKDAIQAEFKAPKDFLARAESVLKGKLGAYLDAKEIEAQQAAAKAADKAQAQVQKLEEKADRLEGEGKETQALAVREQAASVVPVVNVSGAPKVAGIASKEVWKHEVTDFKALVQAVAAGQVPISVLQADDKILANQAKALKGECNYPGVRVYAERSLAAGARPAARSR